MQTRLAHAISASISRSLCTNPAYSHFNIQQRYNHFFLLDQLLNGRYRFLIGTLLKLLSEMQLFMAKK